MCSLLKQNKSKQAKLTVEPNWPELGKMERKWLLPQRWDGVRSKLLNSLLFRHIS